MRYGPKSEYTVPEYVKGKASEQPPGEFYMSADDMREQSRLMHVKSGVALMFWCLIIAIVGGLLLLFAGCAGTPTGDKAAAFAQQYCESLSPLARSAVRAEANAVLAAKAAPGTEPIYVCVDCPGAGDECVAR
jgi:hypothetical protein